jgi:hypothetical protein
MQILRGIQNLGFKSAVIAGGALRDDYTGKPISDIDIFVWDHCYSIQEWKTIPEVPLIESCLSSVIGSNNWKQLLKSSYGPNPDNKLTRIWEYQTSHFPVQVIMTKMKPVEHIEKHFDFGLCKVWSDGVKIRYTPDFLRDVKNKTLTLVAKEMCQREFDYAMQVHHEKLQAKYPTFNTIIPPYNQKLHNEFVLNYR